MTPACGTDKVTATKAAQRIVSAHRDWLPPGYHLKANRWCTWEVWSGDGAGCLLCGHNIQLGYPTERHMVLQFNRANYWMSSDGRTRMNRRTDSITESRVHEECWEWLAND